MFVFEFKVKGISRLNVVASVLLNPIDVGCGGVVMISIAFIAIGDGDGGCGGENGGGGVVEDDVVLIVLGVVGMTTGDPNPYSKSDISKNSLPKGFIGDFGLFEIDSCCSCDDDCRCGGLCIGL